MKRFATLVLLTALSGCYASTVTTTSARSPSFWAVPDHVDFQHHVLFGIINPSGPVDLNAAGACPNGIAAVRSHLGVLGILATLVTVGIYTPVTVQTYCMPATAAAAAH